MVARARLVRVATRFTSRAWLLHSWRSARAPLTAATATGGEGNGRCFDGVCLAIGCSNRVVEPGEQCDDGNQVSLDGCSAECTSSETCGNGVLDDALGERCDDGNLLSRDACDSRCEPEVIEWDVTGLHPLGAFSDLGAFDEARGRFVHFANGYTWEWTDAAGWELASRMTPKPAVRMLLVYDAHRQNVVLLGGSAVSGGVDLVWDWTGTTWQERQTSGDLPPAPPSDAVFDPVGLRIVLAADDMTLFLDSTTSAWASAAGPEVQSGASIGFDGDGVVMIVSGYLDNDPSDFTYHGPASYRLTGTIWTSADASALPTYYVPGPELVWDPDRNALLAFGGNLMDPATYMQSPAPYAYVWMRSAWWPSELGIQRAGFELVHDPVGSRLLQFGTSLSLQGPVDDIRVLPAMATEWTILPERTPGRGTTLAAFDVAREELIVLQRGNAVVTWLWDGSAWSSRTTLGQPRLTDAAIAYDASRAQVVLIDGTSTWAFANNDWEVIAASPAVPASLAFDPSRAQLVAVRSDQLLAFTGSVWTPIGPGVVGVTSVAFDATADRLVACTAMAQVYVHDGAHDGAMWSQTLSPTRASYQLVSDTRRGSVVFVAPASPLWERAASNWEEHEPMPLATDGTVASDPIDGRIAILGVAAQQSLVLVTRRWKSELAREICDGASDADGDGAVGCTDPDCWWRCTPACPPLASCP